jgi:hypothetical protein
MKRLGLKGSMTETIEVSYLAPLRSASADNAAIRKTLHFYNEHLRSSVSNPPQLILLSDDRGNREIAQAEGLIAISTREYVDGLESDEREKLVDLVVGGVDEVAPSERRAKRIYQEVFRTLSELRRIANCLVPPSRCAHCWCQEWPLLPRTLQCQSIQLPRSKLLDTLFRS